MIAQISLTNILGFISDGIYRVRNYPANKLNAPEFSRLADENGLLGVTEFEVIDVRGSEFTRASVKYDGTQKYCIVPGNRKELKNA